MATKEKFSPSKPVGTGNTRLKFNNSPKIAPDADAKKSNPALQMDMFGKDALGSEIGTNANYAAKSKKGFYNEGMCNTKPNQISPTLNY